MTQAPRTLSDMPTVPFADSSDLLEDPGALRARAEEHGYLFFRGLLPAEAVLDVRRRFLRILERHGWLDPNDPTSGRVNLAAFEREERSKVEFCGVGVTPEAYAEVQRILHRELPVIPLFHEDIVVIAKRGVAYEAPRDGRLAPLARGLSIEPR